MIENHEDEIDANMINRVQALNYRCLRCVDRTISPFQVLIGPNASGKSTFLDVIGFMADLLREKEGLPGAVKNRAPDVRDLCWMRAGDVFELAIEAKVPDNLRNQLKNGAYTTVRYELRVGLHPDTKELGLQAETLWLKPESKVPSAAQPAQRSLFPMSPPELPQSLVHPAGKHAPEGWRKVVNKQADSSNDYFMAETSNWNNPFYLGPRRSALANLPEDERRFPVALWFRRTLMDGVQRLALNSESLRRPSPPGSPRTFRPDGSNLPWVVADLPEDRLRDWVSHVAQALPDLREITTIERPEDRHRYLVLKYNTGLEAPSWLVSDGTLRLLALTLLAYLPRLEGIYLVEEPENGIHPRAVETALQSLASVYDAQVLMATHSPVVLSLTRPEHLLCFARTPEGETDVVLGSEHPRLQAWQRETDLGTLFASGILG